MDSGQLEVREGGKPNNLDVQEEVFGRILYSTFINGILSGHYEQLCNIYLMTWKYASNILLSEKKRQARKQSDPTFAKRKKLFT